MPALYIMVSGGSEATITDIGISGFIAIRAIRALSERERNDDPKTA